MGFSITVPKGYRVVVRILEDGTTEITVKPRVLDPVRSKPNQTRRRIDSMRFRSNTEGDSRC
jgi:hypothetical protein